MKKSDNSTVVFLSSCDKQPKSAQDIEEDDTNIEEIINSTSPQNWISILKSKGIENFEKLQLVIGESLANSNSSEEEEREIPLPKHHCLHTSPKFTEYLYSDVDEEGSEDGDPIHIPITIKKEKETLIIYREKWAKQIIKYISQLTGTKAYIIKPQIRLKIKAVMERDRSYLLKKLFAFSRRYVNSLKKNLDSHVFEVRIKDPAKLKEPSSSVMLRPLNECNESYIAYVKEFMKIMQSFTETLNSLSPVFTLLYHFIKTSVGITLQEMQWRLFYEEIYLLKVYFLPLMIYYFQSPAKAQYLDAIKHLSDTFKEYKVKWNNSIKAMNEQSKKLVCNIIDVDGGSLSIHSTDPLISAKKDKKLGVSKSSKHKSKKTKTKVASQENEDKLIMERMDIFPDLTLNPKLPSSSKKKNKLLQNKINTNEEEKGETVLEKGADVQNTNAGEKVKLVPNICPELIARMEQKLRKKLNSKA